MHVLTIEGSPTQVRKLKKGQSVRIKQGKGFNLIVHPNTYKLASRAFNKGKALQVKLTPEEININKQASENPEILNQAEEVHGEMTGKGLFSFIGKILKPLGKVLRPVLKPLAPVLKPLAKAGLGKVFDVAGSMLGNVPGPIGMLAKPLLGELQKGIESKVDSAGNGLYAGRGMYDSSLGYRGGASARGFGIMSEMSKLAKAQRGAGLMDFPEVRKAHERQKIRADNNFSGFGDLRRASEGYYKANKQRSDMNADHYNTRLSQNPRPSYEDEQFAPRSRGYGFVPEPFSRSITGRGGGMLQAEFYPPALVSQPYSANYQMSHFLPIQYQPYNRSMHEPFSRNGNGLYM